MTVAIAVVFIAALLVVFGDSYNRFITANNWPLPKVKEVPFRLGLDLQGGSQLTYDADVTSCSSRSGCRR